MAETNVEKNIPVIKTIPLWRKIIGFGLIFVSIAMICYKDFSLNHKVAPIATMLHNAYELPNDYEVDEDFNDEVIIVKSQKTRPHPAFGLTELDFDLRFASQMRVKRDVQYCQWEESIETVDGEEKYTYTKGWTSYLVDSSQFKESKTHYNPQRNPYPAHVKMPRKLLVGNYIVEKEYFLEFPIQYNVFHPTQKVIETLPMKARTNGFYYADHEYYYSDYNLVEPNGMLKRNNVTLLEEDSERLNQFINDCTPGDIRVQFATQKVPFPVTVVGIQHDHYLRPPENPTTEAPIYINLFGELNQNAIIQHYYKYDFNEAYYIRILGGMGIFVGMLILSGIHTPFKFLPHFLRSLGTAILTPFYLYAGITIYSYGLHDTYTYAAILYLILPSLLFRTLNTLYKYIRVYNYYLKYIKPEQDKKIREEEEKKNN